MKQLFEEAIGVVLAQSTLTQVYTVALSWNFKDFTKYCLWLAFGIKRWKEKEKKLQVVTWY